MSDSLTRLPTFDDMTLHDVAQLTPEQMAALPFGITGLSADGIVKVYSATEARLAGLSVESVLGQHYFSVTAQCMNNFLVAQRFEDEESPNETLDYVLTLRMRPTPVRLKLLKGSQAPSSISSSSACRDPMLDDLERENNELLEFLYACPVGLIQTDIDGSMTMMNPLAMQLLLALNDGVQSSNLFDAMARSAPDLGHMIRAFTLDRGQICRGHRLYVGHASGGRTTIPQVIACTIVKLGPERLMATLEDVSERVAQERRLKQADAWFASFVNGADGFAVLGLDQQGCIDSLDEATRQQTGFGDSDLIGAPLSTLDRADPATATMTIADEIDFARRDGWHLAEGWCARHDGGRYRCQRLITVRSDTIGIVGQVAGYTVVLRPVSHHRLDAEMLRLRLTTDVLTNAYNRAYFFDVADEEIRRCARRERPVGLIVLDIDHFKLVNDTHGHGVGDIVLKIVASTCMAVLRPSDIFARIGGEEFAVLLPSADTDMTADTAERMRSAIAAALIAVEQTNLRVTASLGYVAGDAASQPLSTLLPRADRALYNAKRSGRNRVMGDLVTSAAA